VDRSSDAAKFIFGLLPNVGAKKKVAYGIRLESFFVGAVGLVRKG